MNKAHGAASTVEILFNSDTCIGGKGDRVPRRVAFATRVFAFPAASEAEDA